MITIKLIDARRGLYLKCRELFGDEKIAENIYNYLCEGIEECEECEPERKTGRWVGADSQCGIGCPFCGAPVDDFCSSIDYIDLRYEPNFCPNCVADMRGELK